MTFDSRSTGQSVAATISRFAEIEGVRRRRSVGSDDRRRAGPADRPARVGERRRARARLSDRYELEPNDRVRAYAVDVGGRTVTILVEAPAAEFESFVAVAQRVLESVRWG